MPDFSSKSSRQRQNKSGKSDPYHATGAMKQPPPYGLDFADERAGIEQDLLQPKPAYPLFGKLQEHFKTDFSNLQIHPNSLKAVKIGALAYTQGSSIHFAPGQFDLGSKKGRELFGHELGHYDQQQNGIIKNNMEIGEVGVNYDPILEKQADITGKMIGNLHPAMAEQLISGEASGPSNQNATPGNSPVQPKLRADLLEKFREKSSYSFTNPTSENEALLGKLEFLTMKYLLNQKNNLSQSDAEKTVKLTEMNKLIDQCLKDSGSGENREGLIWLQRRIKAELIGVSEINLTGVKGKADSGATKEVKTGLKLKEKIGSSESKKGVFIPSTDVNVAKIPQARESGISIENPNLEHKAIASSSLANLFGSSVIAETVKGSLDGVEGLIQEDAGSIGGQVQKITQTSKATVEESNYALENLLIDISENADKDQQAMGGEDYLYYHTRNNKLYKEFHYDSGIDFDNPQLQEQLVELHLLDAISGQVDRHHGNYFVIQNKGKSPQVKGIDLDLAFGHLKNVARVHQDDKSPPELPPFVTQDLFDRIMQIDREDILAVLHDKLTTEEIEQTVRRLEQVKTHLRKLQSEDKVYPRFKQIPFPVRESAFTAKNSYIGRDKRWKEKHPKPDRKLKDPPKEYLHRTKE